MINSLDVFLIVVTAVSLAYVLHVWWSTKHGSLLANPVVAIIQIIGILAGVKFISEFVDARYHGEAFELSHALFEVGIFSLVCAPIIFLLFIRPLYSAIRESAKQTSGIIDNAANPIITVDSGFTILSANKAAERMFEYSSKALEGQNVKMLIHDLPSPEAPGLNTLFDSESVWAAGRTIEAMGVPQKGPEIPLELRVSEHTVRNERLFTIIIRDLSEEKKSDAFYKNLFENSLIGQYIVSEGKFVFVNSHFSKSTGYSGDELLNSERCIDFVHEQDRDEVRANAVEMLKGKRSKPYEYRVTTRDGKAKWILESVASIEYNGKRATLGNFMDIQRYKKMEDELKVTNQNLAARVQELERKYEHIEIMNEMSEVVQSCFTVEEACRTVVFYAQKLFPAESGAICLIDDTTKQVGLVSSWGKAGLTKEMFAVDECWGLRRGLTHIVKHSEEGLRCAHLDDPRLHDYICIPLISQTTTLGIFFLSAYSDSVNYLSDKALKNKAKLARTVAEYASLALRNIKLQENLRQKSIRDPLTGLYNRGYLKETLEREVLQASRRNDSLGVIILDVDHFKHYNDTFGHDAGDAVLTAVSKLLQKNVRGGDIACRYGGEEFLILMPGISADDAMERAEKVRLEAGRLHVTHAGRTLDAVTVSLGISVHPDTCQTADELIATADEALYRAKQEGRNRTVLHGRDGAADDSDGQGEEFNPGNVYYF